MTASSAATARRARSARPSAWRPRWRAACRATSPQDLHADDIALNHDELRERMSGNLCRCGAHNGIVDAIAETFARGGRAMNPTSTYARAADAQPTPFALARAGRREVSRRRHQSGRPDAREHRAADRAGRRHRPRPRRSTRLQDGGLLIGAAARNTALAAHRAVRARYPDAVAGDPRRRLGADPQHGDGRRQHPAAHALLLLLRRRGSRCNKREPGTGCDAIERLQPHPRDPRRVGRVRRHPSVRHVRRAGRARRDRASGRAGRRARRCRSSTSIACRATRPTSRPCLRPAS